MIRTRSQYCLKALKFLRSSRLLYVLYYLSILYSHHSPESLVLQRSINLAKEKVLTKELNILIEESKAIKNKVRRLSDTSLDLELLDQQARIILGMIGEEELIVF